MATYTIQDTSLVNIADAIRAKTGDTAEMTPAEMVAAIQGITTGGGDDDVPATITGHNYFDYGGDWDYFVKKYADRITVNSTYSIFDGATDLDGISALTIKPPVSNYMMTFTKTFYNCYALTELPTVDLSSQSTQNAFKYNMDNAFYNCYLLKNVPDDWMPLNTTSTSGSTVTSMKNLFTGCISLRKYPQFLASHQYWNSASGCSYASAFMDCKYISRIENLPVNQATLTTNQFSNAFKNCLCLKHLTFATDNGTAKTASWKNQVIDLTYAGTPLTYFSLGSAEDVSDVVNVNSDTLYNQYKDTDNWFSTRYFTYTRQSAVETINSLPDTHAYGTNTIKFGWNASTYAVKYVNKNSSTGKITATAASVYSVAYQGSINKGNHIQAGNWPDELSAEEIAVATAKGWTVTIVNTVMSGFDP